MSRENRGYNAHSDSRRHRRQWRPYSIDQSQERGHRRILSAPIDLADRSQTRCNICSYTQSYPDEKVPIYHRHFSSVHLRELLQVENTENRFYCPSCLSRHQSYSYDKINVVVSDFTLHEFFAPPGNTGATYEGDIMHTDYITIPDAPLPQLLHAFRLDYELTPRPKPLDVVLVAGYVDIMRGFDKEYIVRGFRKFSETVLSLPNKDPKAKNCFTISSLMYPPPSAGYQTTGLCPLDMTISSRYLIG